MTAGRAAGVPSILARMPNWLGDCVMALPALRYLRESFPEAEFIVACRPNLAGFLAAQTGVDRVVVAPKSGILRFAVGMARGAPELSGGKPPGGVDAGILFTTTLSTAAWLWRIGAGNRIGYNSDARNIFLTHPIRCDKRINSLHFLDYYLELAIRAAATAAKQDERFKACDVVVNEAFLQPRLTIDAASRQQAAGLLSAAGVAGPYAVFAPASAYGPVKDWPPGHYRRLARWLADQRDMPVLLTGVAGHRNLCDAIADGHGRIHNLAGSTNLGSFLGLAAGAGLFVGGDSGGAHAAAALAVPTLVIFGVTNPGRTHPTGRHMAILGGSLLKKRLSASETKTLAEEALRSIGAEDAEKAIDALLA